ncbi:DUF1467 family protein [Enterovirga rhinocerotis]|uniref:DUF1467 family protein n=1 Tax=Enterovirga rhinocerotis TaxID=1339210 RepID=UPI001FE17C44|nr:DUF1467 family protein [Enterovirga rhinocerotis]
MDRLAGSIWSTLAAVLALTLIAVSGGRALGLSLVGSVALYFVVWWIVLFAILPVRIKTQSDVGVVTKGTEPGAPADPALLQRAIWTSVAAMAVFVLLAALFPLAGL